VQRASLTAFAWLSIGAAILTIALKTGAYPATKPRSVLKAIPDQLFKRLDQNCAA
jgi:hypothetical protein